jgi:hypothetical protein
MINNTNISFSNSAMNLLQKGLKYNIYAKKRNWIQTLALEAETAITQLPANERDVYRKLVADRIITPQEQNPTHKTHPETKVINLLQIKLKDNDPTIIRADNEAMITRADKGNTTVILPTQNYETKLQDFLRNNDFHTSTTDPTTIFHTSTTDPTTTFQTQIRTTIRQSPTPIPKEYRWKYINMNLSAPLHQRSNKVT